MEFPKYGRTIDTARFVRSYSYKNGFYLSSTLALRDSSFIMVINPRMDCPAISFTDMEVEERMDQYRRLLEKQLAEDSVVIVVTAPGGMPSLSERVLRGEEKWSPSPLSFGERVTFEELKTTIEFKGIGVRKSHRGEELTTKNATIFLTVDHNGLKREVAISADTDRSCSYCQCVGIADDLPTWIVCASMFKKLSDTYQILVNINQSLRN